MFRRSDVVEGDAVDVWNPDRPLTDDLAAFLGADIGVARQFLPNSTLTSLYWLMVSQQSSESGAKAYSIVVHLSEGLDICVASLSEAPREKQHADCRQCFRRRGLIARCSDVPGRVNLAREWRLYLRATYHDRMIYWWCRYASRHNLDVLTIIIDSMDKAKLAWPPWPWWGH